ncbi:MAG: efflux RND transporter periplasmic adaptor subunit [Planctomycetes bacterium]|nr:efflux RND transporter periplasmic adaptor subunit [Planctomycetota bacterium]MCB9934812.1 efflux RND transporter periplasmic adaptor subunit [Planctomycetota bacterium]
MKTYGLIFGLCLVLSACGGDSSDKGKWGGNGEEVERKDPLVEVVHARRDNISRFERSTGRIEAHTQADVYAQLSEVANEVLVEVGDRVQRGDVLARLDRGKAELQVAASMIAAQEAELGHRKNKLDLEKKRSDFERIEKYFDPAKPEASRLYSKDAYDAAKLEYDKASNLVESSSLALQKAQGDLAVNQLQLAYTIIKAPISGVITERNIRANELVGANALVFRIADLAELEVRLDVAEASLKDLREPDRIKGIGLFALHEKTDFSTAQAVLLSLTAFPTARFLGYVDRISPTVDEARGMIVVTVRIIRPENVSNAENPGQTAADILPLFNQLDPDARKAVLGTAQRVSTGERMDIRPGSWVDARISTSVERNVLLIPSAAIVSDAEQIWLIDLAKDGETGTARRIDVSRRRGVDSENSFELRDAPADADKTQQVKEGDLIVVRGQSLLRDGQKVRVRDLSK